MLLQLAVSFRVAADFSTLPVELLEQMIIGYVNLNDRLALRATSKEMRGHVDRATSRRFGLRASTEVVRLMKYPFFRNPNLTYGPYGHKGYDVWKAWKEGPTDHLKFLQKEGLGTALEFVVFQMFTGPGRVRKYRSELQKYEFEPDMYYESITDQPCLCHSYYGDYGEAFLMPDDDTFWSQKRKEEDLAREMEFEWQRKHEMRELKRRRIARALRLLAD